MDLKDWTLMTGDHELMTYAVFVKAIYNNKMAVKIYFGIRILEIQPGEFKPVLLLDGTIIENFKKELIISTTLNDKFYLKYGLLILYDISSTKFSSCFTKVYFYQTIA
jgi:hypothetical protein